MDKPERKKLYQLFIITVIITIFVGQFHLFGQRNVIIAAGKNSKQRQKFNSIFGNERKLTFLTQCQIQLWINLELYVVHLKPKHERNHIKFHLIGSERKTKIEQKSLPAKSQTKKWIFFQTISSTFEPIVGLVCTTSFIRN